MKDAITNYINENYPESSDKILLADGFEDAFMGVVCSMGSQPKACYDISKCLDILQNRDGMTLEEAGEFFDYNVTGAYVGEFTPSFIVPFDIEEELSEGDKGENDYLG
jgi:hypothetical protein